MTKAVRSRVKFTKSIDGSVVKNRTVLITGGASGIGAGFAKALAKNGAIVTIADFNADLGRQFTKDLESEGIEIRFVQADVTSWDSQIVAFKQCIATSPNGTIDIVIPCAGVAGHSILGVLHTPEDANGDPLPPPTSTLAVNTTGVFYTAHLALHYFEKTMGSGNTPSAEKQLVFVSSTIAYTAMPLMSDYTASKFAVRGLWKSIRGNADVLGIRTNLIAPSLTRTPFTKEMVPFLEAKGVKMASVQDCVDVLLRIVCDASVLGLGFYTCFTSRADRF